MQGLRHLRPAVAAEVAGLVLGQPQLLAGFLDESPLGAPHIAAARDDSITAAVAALLDTEHAALCQPYLDRRTETLCQHSVKPIVSLGK